MTNNLIHKGKKIYYKYDDYQDALFLTFVEKPGITYYEELDNGILVRKDAESDEIIGYTVRNISTKILKSYLEGDVLIPSAT